MHKRLLAIFMIMSISITSTGCFSILNLKNEKENVTENKSEYESFSEYCDSLVVESIKSDAMSAHYEVSNPKKFGVEFSEDDYTLGTIDMDEINEDYEKIKEALEIIESFDDDDLTDEEKITKECLVEYYETKLMYEGTDWLYNVLSPTNGITSALSTNFIEFAFFDEDDVEQYLMFLKSVPDYMDSLYDFARKQAQMGYFMPDYVVDQTIDACEQYLDAENEPLLITFEDKISKLDISDSEKAEYITLNEEYVEEYYLPVYEDVIDLLEELKGSGINDGGLCGFGNLGIKYYEAIVREKASEDISPEDLAEYFDDAMEDVIEEMTSIYVKDDDAYYNATSVTTDYKTPEEAIEFLCNNVDEVFPKPATDEYIIEYQNPACEIDGVIAYYVNCRIDDIHYNSIKVNASAIEEKSVDMYLTIAHEGYPGHLYQFTSCYGNDDVLNARKVMDFIGVTEGWAEYSSICSLELLELSKEYQKMIYLDDVFVYIVCSRLDIGVNYEGWDKNDAKEYLEEYLSVDDELVDELYYSAIADPGVYIPYTYGQLRMWELREMAEDELEDSFDQKEYHEFLVDLGIAPFNVIENELKDWLRQ